MITHKPVNHFLLALLLPLSLSALAQTASIKKSPPLAEASPRSVGMSAERLGRIDELCRKAVADGDIPGVAALVARRGKIVYYKDVAACVKFVEDYAAGL